jgi:hypothetical protein
MRPTRVELLKQMLENQKVLLRQSVQPHVTFADFEIVASAVKDTEFLLSKDYPKVVKEKDIKPNTKGVRDVRSN